MPILAAFAQLDTDQHPFGIDVADPQHDDLAAAQTGAVGDTERGLVLETGAGRGLDQLGDLLASKNPRQLPRVVRAGQLMGEVGAPKRDGEKEAQRRGLRIHLRWLRTLLDLCELEAADVVAARGIGGAAEKSGKGRDMPDIVALCLVAKAPDRHVRDHAAAKIADRLVAHQRLLSRGWSVGTPNPQDGTPGPSSSLDQLVGANPRRLLPSRASGFVPCPIPDLETVVPTGHPDQTQSFNSPALDRALQPNNDPFGAPWSAAMDVGGWLRGLGLGQYEALFRASEIDADILPELTDADLEKLSVPLGHRKRLLRAISGLAAAEISAAPSAPTGAKPHDAAERRQLTVMFCDLVGSTALSVRFDPEDLRKIIGAYHRCVTEIAEGFGGFVARYMGDGVLVYFGYPRAHEDGAERATRCGLALVERVAQLGQGEELQARVGIATGLVVVGGEVVEHDVAGETPNLAARLQALAKPGQIVVAGATRRLVGDLFRLTDLGRQTAKGFAAPVEAFVVEGVAVTESRFEAARRGLVDLVGRAPESALLRGRLREAWAGAGQIVLLSGEAGIGKSRLAAQLATEVANEPHTRLRYQCSPYHRDSVLHPFVVQLGRAARLAPDVPAETQLDKLEG